MISEHQRQTRGKDDREMDIMCPCNSMVQTKTEPKPYQTSNNVSAHTTEYQTKTRARLLLHITYGGNYNNMV